MLLTIYVKCQRPGLLPEDMVTEISMRIYELESKGKNTEEKENVK